MFFFIGGIFGLSVRDQINEAGKDLWTEYLSDTATGALKKAGCKICPGPTEVHRKDPTQIFSGLNPFRRSLPEQ
jgi:hypothetical protein